MPTSLFYQKQGGKSLEKFYQHKTVAITGGASGIGEEIAKQIADCQAKAIALLDMTYNDDATCERSVKQLAERFSGVKIATYAVDTCDLAAVEQVFAQIKQNFGALDIVIHCAGVSSIGEVATSPAEEFERVNRVNLFGSRNIAATAFPYLKETQGNFLIIASLAGILPCYGYAAYNTSKYATLALAEVIYLEWKPQGVNVSVACPPEIPTPLLVKEGAYPYAVAQKLKKVAGFIPLVPVCQYLLKGFAKGRVRIIPGKRAKLLAFTQGISPSFNRFVNNLLVAYYRKKQ